MKRIIVAALTLPVFLVGCGAADGESYSPDNGEKSDIPNGLHYIKKVDVDGTTCVIFRDGDMGGLDCGLQGPVEDEPTLDEFGNLQ